MTSLRVAHVNVRSLVPKLGEIADYVRENGLDAIAISETWLTPAVSSTDIPLTGYKLFRLDRAGSRGGGVCIYIRSSLRPGLISCDGTMEQLWVHFKCSHITISFGVVYRPHTLNYKLFTDALEESLSICGARSDYTLCSGDINIDLLDVDKPASLYFKNMLDSLGYDQLIDEPTRVTHNSQTLLDVLLCSDTSIVTDFGVCNFPVSDHDLTYCTLNLKKPVPEPVHRVVRTFGDFNYQCFQDNLKSIPFHNILHMRSIDDKIIFLCSNLLELFNVHAPLKNVNIIKDRVPWLTDNIRLMMSLRDKARSTYLRYIKFLFLNT